MMRFIGIVVGVFVVAVLLCGAATVYGRTRTDPDMPHFQNCEGLPCMFGVQPGYTTWLDARADLAALNPREMSRARIILRADNGDWIEMYPSMDHVSVGSISYFPPRNRIVPVAWVIARYGAPCSVTVYRYSDIVTLRYPFLLANVLVPEDEFHHHTPINTLYFTDPAYKSNIQRDVCVDNITDGAANRRWLGFTSISSYLRSPIYRGR
jgi:hypothetical protein